ncbi:MAG: aminotransferase class I/II-fold pyridoxal phosphate-dependent enzyme [Chloroflexi bacterium]|nr:aminotransferase class I/II-fold pyridoxal phosphate-dependent enzyme [Chloroflexota bacterium]
MVSRRMQKIPSSGIRRFFDLIASIDGVISLGVGEPDYATPWHICESAVYAMERGRTMYTSNYGLLELRQGLSRHLEARYGLEYDPGRELLITAGVSEALDLALRAVLNPGEEVIAPEPSYVSYAPCTIMAGGVFVSVPTYAEDGFQVRAVDIRDRINQRTKAILLNYPNNPTGSVLDRAEMVKVAEVARQHDLLVISDEIYDRLVYEVEHTCFASLPGMRERTILLGGFSKAYAMTGWRVGYAAAPADIIEAMMKIHQYTMLCAPIMAQVAAIEALRAGESDVQEMVADYGQRRRVMVKGLNDIGLACSEPQGAFYAFPSIKTTGLSSVEFAERLLKEERVVVVPGSAFGSSGEGHIRCCYAVSLPEMEEALERMGRFVERHRR